MNVKILRGDIKGYPRLYGTVHLLWDGEAGGIGGLREKPKKVAAKKIKGKKGKRGEVERNSEIQFEIVGVTYFGEGGVPLKFFLMGCGANLQWAICK